MIGAVFRIHVLLFERFSVLFVNCIALKTEISLLFDGVFALCYTVFRRMTT